MAPFLILLGIIIVGSMFFFVICNPSSSAFGYNEASLGALWPLFTVFLASMGNPIDVLGTDDFGTWPAILMLCGFLFFVVIILCASSSSSPLDSLRMLLLSACLLPRRMNVLIAIMADSYEMVKEHEKVEALHERAKMIADMELLHPGWHRFSTYMHVCEAADEDSGLEPEWSGVAGRVKVLLAESTQQLQQEVAALRSQMSRADDVAALSNDVGELKSDVAGLKGLLEQLLAVPRG